MRTVSVAQRAAFVSAALGILLGVLFLFAPIQGYCISTITGTGPPLGATPAPATVGQTTCGVEALWQRQQIFPMPFFAVLVWSLAPVVVYFGVRLRVAGERSTGTALAIAGVLLEGTVLTSLGAAPFFVPFVLLPLAITTTIALKRS
jgi:hypothetical protein